ncbi:hypothetical protein NVV93_12450 [Pseudomonas sp. LS44]|uniref:hypothetical protein n=1 Tax=Pseudomonas sp. LS44 TaxID=1357074 RepID=UPI00215B534C|nr:hypothetical protein [Pseudomonas sp. LS44]UVE16423.1 hypothetical protein NVV93_12450 [Pseudomonas sp. LS44]
MNSSRLLALTLSGLLAGAAWPVLAEGDIPSPANPSAVPSRGPTLDKDRQADNLDSTIDEDHSSGTLNRGAPQAGERINDSQRGSGMGRDPDTGSSKTGSSTSGSPGPRGDY